MTITTQDIYERINKKEYERGSYDLFTDFCKSEGIDPTTKKAGRLWSIAWEMGHSSGYSEVFNYLLELVELIRD